MSERVIFINSYIDRTTLDTDTSEWTTYLSEPIRVKSGKIRLTVENIELPNTAYSFGNSENRFYWVHGVGTTNTVRSVVIATDRIFGSGTEFATYINGLMTSSGFNLSFSFSSTTLELSITNNETVPIRICSSYRYSDLQTGSSDAQDKLGFNQNTIGTQTAAGGVITANGILKLIRTNCYYLTANIIGNNFKQSILPSPYYSHSIIARITANTIGSLSQLQYASSMFFNCSETVINAIKFKLLDDQLYPISLNGLPITFVMKLLIE
jgi:hypothetical protein